MVSTNRRALVLFSKAPELVRRAPDEPYSGLPWTDLDALYYAMLDDVIDTVSTVHAIDVYIVKTSDEPSSEFMNRVGTNVQLLELEKMTSDEKIHYAIETMFAKQYEHVVLLLEPHPMITAHDIKSAFGLLQYDDDSVVIGQHSDGKYFLLGLKADHSDIFEPVGESETVIKYGGLLQRFCEQEMMLFPMLPKYRLDNGLNLERLKIELEEIANGNGFASRTRTMFRTLDKKYRIRRAH